MGFEQNLQRICCLAPKSYVYQTAKKADSQAAKIHMKMKGLQLYHSARNALTIDFFQKLAQESLTEQDVSEVHSYMANEAKDEKFTSSCQQVWQEEHKFSIPQPGLRSKGFKIYPNDNALKRIGSSFWKRILLRERIYDPPLRRDLARLGELTEYASIPFGHSICRQAYSEKK